MPLLVLSGAKLEAQSLKYEFDINQQSRYDSSEESKRQWGKVHELLDHENPPIHQHLRHSSQLYDLYENHPERFKLLLMQLGMSDGKIDDFFVAQKNEEQFRQREERLRVLEGNGPNSIYALQGKVNKATEEVSKANALVQEKQDEYNKAKDDLDRFLKNTTFIPLADIVDIKNTLDMQIKVKSEQEKNLNNINGKLIMAQNKRS